MKNLEKQLREVPLFLDLSDAEFTKLAQVGHERSLTKGSYLFFEDDPADMFYILLKGSVTILLTASDGRELIINEIRSGECVGELALITNLPRSATAMTREKCEVVSYTRDDFLGLIQRNPYIERRLLQITAERLHESNQRERALAFLDAPGRLARILLQLHAQEINTGYITISQDELACRTGLTRQTVAKILGYWRRAGWVITGRGKIVLLNIGELEHYV